MRTSSIGARIDWPPPPWVLSENCLSCLLSFCLYNGSTVINSIVASAGLAAAALSYVFCASPLSWTVAAASLTGLFRGKLLEFSSISYRLMSS